MPRESGVELEKVTINLHTGDKETLASFYSVMGWTVAARRIIHKFCEVLREKDSQEIQANAKPLDVDIPSIEDIEKE